jgi:Mg2+ and Co2+ transporter CorA
MDKKMELTELSKQVIKSNAISRMIVIGDVGTIEELLAKAKTRLHAIEYHFCEEEMLKVISDLKEQVTELERSMLVTTDLINELYQEREQRWTNED